MTKPDSRVTPDYSRFIAELKERIQSARVAAARAVNRELILLYWDIGRAIVEKQKALGWGDSIVERLARDLQAAFPHNRGFSRQNVWRMRQFFIDHTTPEFLAQLVPELRRAPLAERVLSQFVRELPTGVPEPRRQENLSQAVRELVATIPWGHHANVLASVRSPRARLYYLLAPCA